MDDKGCDGVGPLADDQCLEGIEPKPGIAQVYPVGQEPSGNIFVFTQGCERVVLPCASWPDQRL